ncbi:hypothetical protein GGTG_07904 [Gaeumannomyces tritici R3-111a-1]|uniref:Uncharacterized protein n=1 Tax=Gaeumannomyces tritici (strain R3-111a-1) TaxID=644352 RepID=J3P313_GAET3|nr:hypothetical protein GGTG_07904 [Gaeumannomyces tritici R3-111a-1]EJT74055.1 hypothetical protein GGTG_07904 [Gaeumannomyces tritici R3-111a-1]
MEQAIVAPVNTARHVCASATRRAQAEADYEGMGGAARAAEASRSVRSDNYYDRAAWIETLRPAGIR